MRPCQSLALYDLRNRYGGIMAFLLGLLSISFSIFASPHFTTVRFDQTIPEECQDMELGFYQLPPEFFFVGRQDGVKMGYTFEYPIKRGDATILWHYFQ